MAKVYTGRDGEMHVGGAKIAKVVNFSVQANLETLETTTLDEHLRSYVPGVTGYSGSATLLYYKDDSNNINTTNVLNKLFKTGATGVSSTDTVELKFRWKDESDNNDITLNAYITSASIGAATADIVRAEIAFQGVGELVAASIS